jgi:hypothetical protein
MSTSDPSQSPTVGASPEGAQADPSPNDSDDCAQIPTAAHVVLQASIQIVIQLAIPLDVASQMSNTLTLTNEDGTYTKTLTFASDCQAGDDGTSKLTFDGLTDGHTYSLQGQDDDGSYTVFAGIAYQDLVGEFGGGGSGGGDPPASSSPDSSSPADNASGTP